MTSLTALKRAAKKAGGESPTAHEIRLEEVKEAYIEVELTEPEFEELLDASFSGGPPYRANVILTDRSTMGVPTPEDSDEHVVENRGKYFTIDGNIARVREETPDWENVINVTGGPIPDEDEIEEIKREKEQSEEVKEKQVELRRQILGQ